jgi:hypothetical protein
VREDAARLIQISREQLREHFDPERLARAAAFNLRGEDEAFATYFLAGLCEVAALPVVDDALSR